MQATHYYPETEHFHEAYYIVQDGKITHYMLTKSKAAKNLNVWLDVDSAPKYNVFPNVDELQPFESEV